jgi:hypothetical protein
VSWDLEFFKPIALPGKRKPLVTLRDAVKYMTSLPRKEQAAEHWRPAATLLAIIGEKGGCLFLAKRAVAFGLRKGAKAAPPEFDPDRKRNRSWGKRKLKRRMSVWIYTDTNKQEGDVERLKVFATADAANELFKVNDPEGVAFEYEVSQ